MRIRTIKPEFWTDPLMVKLPRFTRLMYIALWSAADDHGCLVDEPERLALELMPREPLEDVLLAIDELVAVGRLVRRECEHRTFLVIVNWQKHQRVDHPARSRFLGGSREDSGGLGGSRNSARLDLGPRTLEKDHDRPREESQAPPVDNSGSSSSLGIEVVTAAVVDWIVNHSIGVRKPKAYRAGVERRVRVECAADIAYASKVHTELGSAVQYVVGIPSPAVTVPRIQAKYEAESFVAARWLTGETKESILSELGSRYGPGTPEHEAGLAELARREEATRMLHGAHDG